MRLVEGAPQRRWRRVLWGLHVRKLAADALELGDDVDKGRARRPQASPPRVYVNERAAVAVSELVHGGRRVMVALRDVRAACGAPVVVKVAVEELAQVLQEPNGRPDSRCAWPHVLHESHLQFGGELARTAKLILQQRQRVACAQLCHLTRQRPHATFQCGHPRVARVDLPLEVVYVVHEALDLGSVRRVRRGHLATHARQFRTERVAVTARCHQLALQRLDTRRQCDILLVHREELEAQTVVLLVQRVVLVRQRRLGEPTRRQLSADGIKVLPNRHEALGIGDGGDAERALACSEDCRSGRLG